MELSVEMQGLLMLGVGSFVAFVLTQLTKRGLDLSGYQSKFTAGLFSAVLVIVNALLTKVPADSVNIVESALQIVVILFGAAGIHGLIKSKKQAI